MRERDKPVGEAAGWKLLDTSYPFATPWLKLRQDRVRLHGEHEIEYTYVDSSDAVGIIPLTADGKIVLIRQYRYTVDDWCLEVPAGGMHDAEGASLEEVARTELRQEIGARCDDLLSVGSFYSCNGSSSQTFWVYLAMGVTLDEQPAHEITEDIEIHPVPVVEALRLARHGRIKDGMSALSLLLCEPKLRELGYLSGE